MSHEQLYSDLLLFLPYRDESTELFVDANECTELYERSKALINQNKKSIFPYSEDIDLVNMIMESDEKKKVQEAQIRQKYKGLAGSKGLKGVKLKVKGAEQSIIAMKLVSEQK